MTLGRWVPGGSVFVWIVLCTVFAKNPTGHSANLRAGGAVLPVKECRATSAAYAFLPSADVGLDVLMVDVNDVRLDLACVTVFAACRGH